MKHSETKQMASTHIYPHFWPCLALDGDDGSISCPGCFTPGEETPVSIGEEAALAREPQTLWGREQFLPLPRTEP
jgi:hypothetical protein